MDLSIVVRLANVKLWLRKPGPRLTAVVQDLLYRAESVRRLKGLRLSEPMPDESNILHFRHLLERRRPGQGLFEEFRAHLEGAGDDPEGRNHRVRHHHSSPRFYQDLYYKSKGQREPDIHQVKKGNQYRLGMKLHVGVDSDTGLN